MRTNFVNSILKINRKKWDTLNASMHPFLQYDFFKLLEVSNSASPSQGWIADHLTIENNNKLQTIIPLYQKQHSWGEFVFDWAWADAFERHGINYYPKLVCALPFTPVFANKQIGEPIDCLQIFDILSKRCEQLQFSSWHILFTEEINQAQLPKEVFHRKTVQFHWFNRAYTDFEHFLASFKARKRKNTRKERLSIDKQGIKIKQLTGEQITAREIDFFYLTYQITYLRRGHTPHLSKEFFEGIFETMKAKVLLILASHQNEYVASALFFYDDTQLFGRYWGCTKQFNNLHFELCYYQGIDFCIRHNLQSFNPGTQGEHKIQRGFEPVFTHSYHWVKQPEFRPAIRSFCELECRELNTYKQQCRHALPFKG